MAAGGVRNSSRTIPTIVRKTPCAGASFWYWDSGCLLRCTLAPVASFTASRGLAASAAEALSDAILLSADGLTLIGV